MTDDNLTAKTAHLGFIQNIISRMGNNSFYLKGWSITIVAALFVLSQKDSKGVFLWLAFIPVFMLWGLDGFFLHQEKLFRELYDEVADGTIDSTVFTLKTKNIKHPDKVDSYFKCLFSKTLRSFHGILSIVIVIVAIIIA